MTADAAAALLGTSTTILGVWEERYGFPVPVRSEDGQRLYSEEAMIALRFALGRTLSVASAITEARRMQPSGPRTPGGQTGSLEKPEEAR
ncbi:MAG TPA: MerR family transcriptional regulator [Solirubrobacteraceae bacterium]|nr:MerR family transcriptional regulator [Solirubrobacteraceae bacterium]